MNEHTHNINMGFWERLPKPFFALAPMADVTDAAFRRLIAKHSRHGEVGGGPDVFWTEFVSANGLVSEGRKVLERDLIYTEGERPIVAQLFTSTPENMRKAAALCRELGFDGIDINMGCPDKTIENQGAGACMIKTPDVAQEIIRAAKEGAGDLPVSVKTRVGYHRDEELETWIPMLLSQGIAALTVHARTRKELSLVPADWSRIKRVVEIRDSMHIPTLILGNGDVQDIADGLERANKTGVDGVMIGRAIFGNPWLFDRNRTIVQKGSWQTSWLQKILPRTLARKLRGGDKRYTVSEVPLREKLDVLIEHCELFEELLGDIKSFAIMKKHFKAYIHGFKGAKELRTELMERGNSTDEVRSIIKNFFEQNTI